MSNIMTIPPDCIPANPDIAGIGIRVSFYFQNIFPLIVILTETVKALRVKPGGVLKIQSILEAQVKTTVVTGSSLFLSAIILAKKGGLDTYHAIIILNLGWIAQMNSAMHGFLKNVAYTVWKKSGEHSDLDDSKFRKPWTLTSKDAESTICSWISFAHYMLISGFGLWFWAKVDTFTATGQCEPNLPVPFRILGHKVLVTDPTIRKVFIALYVPYSITIFLLLGNWVFFMALGVATSLASIALGMVLTVLAIVLKILSPLIKVVMIPVAIIIGVVGACVGWVLGLVLRALWLIMKALVGLVWLALWSLWKALPSVRKSTPQNPVSEQTYSPASARATLPPSRPISPPILSAPPTKSSSTPVPAPPLASQTSLPTSPQTSPPTPQPAFQVSMTSSLSASQIPLPTSLPPSPPTSRPASPPAAMRKSPVISPATSQIHLPMATLVSSPPTPRPASSTASEKSLPITLPAHKRSSPRKYLRSPLAVVDQRVIWLFIPFFIAVDVAMIIDTEHMIRDAKSFVQPGESDWTFGQTIAMFLIIPLIVDVLFIKFGEDEKSSEAEGDPEKGEK